MTRAIAIILLVFGLAAATGCRLHGGPGSLPPPPSNPTIAQMVLSVTPTLDSDADGTLDTARVSLHLFDSAYPAPIDAPGTVRFELVDPADGRELYRWTFDEPVVRASRQRVQAGVVHWFTLELDHAVAGWIPGITDLRVVFEPARPGSRPIAKIHRGLRWGA